MKNHIRNTYKNEGLQRCFSDESTASYVHIKCEIFIYLYVCDFCRYISFPLAMEKKRHSKTYANVNGFRDFNLIKYKHTYIDKLSVIFFNYYNSIYFLYYLFRERKLKCPKGNVNNQFNLVLRRTNVV